MKLLFGALAGLVLAFMLPTVAIAAETVIYIHTDALGSPIAETDAAGNVIKRYVYEPYGAVVGGVVSDGPGYTGHVSDASTGLSYMQQRYYDPALGRFLSSDPVTALTDPTGFFNRYKYAASNPYTYTDPDGRCERVTGSNICGGGAVARAMLATSARSPLDVGANAQSGAPKLSVSAALADLPSQSEQGSNLGGHINFGKLNYETEAVAAYGAGLRYTRDWKTKKDALGVVLIGIGARGGAGKGVTGLPALDMVNAEYNWGSTDSSADIVVNFAINVVGVSLTFDPGSGINASATVSPSIGSYSGISFMFDDTLVPDK